MKDEDLLAFLALNSLRQFDGNLITTLRSRSIAPSDLLSSPSLLREFTNSEKAIERWYEALSSGWHLRELESCKKKGIKILVFNEEGYPSSLNTRIFIPFFLQLSNSLRCHPLDRASYHLSMAFSEFVNSLSKEGELNKSEGAMDLERKVVIKLPSNCLRELRARKANKSSSFKGTTSPVS